MKKLLIAGAVLSLLQACGETTPINSKENNFNASPLGGSAPQYGGDVYYTGYNGTADFSIYLPTSRTIEIVDTTVAEVETIEAGFSQEEATQMAADYETETGIILSTGRKQRMIGRLQTAKKTKIRPLKPGVTLLKATRYRSNGEVRWDTNWQKGEYRTLVVADYQGVSVPNGQARYDNGGGDQTSSPACTVCHTGQATPSNGYIAPPHLLGNVLEVSDANALEWIKTGRALDRVAPIQHAWSFSGPAEEMAVLAYVRQLQVKDAKELGRLIFLSELEADKLENSQI